MSVNDWIAIGVGLTSLIAGFTGAIKWLVKHYLAELKPNGGSSLKDKVDRLETRVDEIYTLLISKD